MKKIYPFLSIVLILGLVAFLNFFISDQSKTTPKASSPTLQVVQGGTGATTLTGCLTGNGTGPITGTGSACGSGGGGGGGGTFSTSTISNYPFLINYPNNATDVVLFGSTSATSSAEYWFDSNFERASIGRTTNASTTIYGNLFLSKLSNGGLAVINGLVSSGATTTAGTGLTYSGNAFNVNTSQNIATLSNLTGNGLVKTSGGVGTLGTAVNGTDYTLITALTCSAGQHFSQVTAGGVFTCSADTGTGGGAYDAWTHPFAGSSATTSLMLLYGNASTTGFSANYAKIGATASTTFGADGFVGISTTTRSMWGTDNPILNVQGTTTINGYLALGLPRQSDIPWSTNQLADITCKNVGYCGVTMANLDTGTTGSIDLLFNNNNTAQSVFSYLADIGFNGSGNADPLYTGLGGANAFYQYNTDGQFAQAIATTSSVGFFNWLTGGYLTSNEKMRLTNDGKLGIGSSTPWAQLSINPTSTLGSAPSFVIGSSTATNFVVSNRGFVGIGTTTPGFNFEVNASSTTLGLYKQQIPGATALGVLTLIHQNSQAPISGSVVNANFIAANEMGFSTSPGTYIALGLNGVCTVKTSDSPTWGASSQCTGGAFAANYNGTGALPQLFGITAAVKKDGTGNITSKMYSIMTSNDQGSSATSGTVTEAGGLIINRPTGTTGMTFTNIFGIRIANQTPASGTKTNTPYGLAQDGTGDYNYFLGKLGVGSTTPAYGFVVATSTAMTNLTASSGTPNSLCINAITKEVTENSALTCTVSSKSQKNQYGYLGDSLDTLMSLKPAIFSYKDQPNRTRWGFYAEDVASVNHALGDGYDKNGNPQSLDQNAILALTVKAVQELAISKGVAVKRSVEEDWQTWGLILAFILIGLQQLQIRKLKK